MEKLKYGSRCDECEKQKYETLICLECVETLCRDCDRAVHNKGTRVRHRRYQSQRVFYEDFKRDLRFRILYFSPECYRTVLLKPNVSELVRDIAEKTFEIVCSNTQQGHPMTRIDELIPLLSKDMDKKPSESKIQSILQRILKTEKLFTFTTRKFGDSKEEGFLSLSLSCISVEALSWILRSIQNDKMQPSQNLIHSRIKEFFDIKIGQKEWKKFIENLTPKLISKMNKFSHEIPEIKIKKVSEELVLFYFKEEGEWEYEDFSEVKDTDNDYKLFLKYIDDFFSKNDSDIIEDKIESKINNKSKHGHYRNKKYKLLDTNRKYKQIKPKNKILSQSELLNHDNHYNNQCNKIRDNIYSPYRNNLQYTQSRDGLSGESNHRDNSWNSQRSGSDIRIWLSSVERPLDNSRSASSQNEINAEKMLMSRGLNKAIPGGKYGCALMIKRCGPEQLKKKSLGRVLALIKKSLEQGILNHWKTLLVRNNNKSDIDSTLREQKIYDYSRNVIELLKEHREGISLAQFKQYYNRKFPNKSFDFEDLQFAKLTDFLKTMNEFVAIERRPRNNNVAFLRKNKNPRKAIAHYTHLLKSLCSKKKYKNGPEEEYGHTMEMLQNRRMENIRLLESETNIYQRQSKKNYYTHKDQQNNFDISKYYFYF